MNDNIAVITGGNSSEFSISINSAGQVMQQIDRRLFTPYKIIIKQGKWTYEPEDGSDPVPVDLNDFSLKLSGEKITFGAVFIAIHGSPGEDGKIQSYFDLIGMPYTSCSSFVSALTFNKFACKKFLEAFHILTPPSFLTRRLITAEEVIQAGIPFPLFIKANSSGSSYGVTPVDNPEKLKPALMKAFKECPEAIVEAGIKGTEVTCGLLKTRKEEIVLPPTEIVPHNSEFFDFEAKYTPGMSDEITPARLPESKLKLVQDTASKIYDILGCKGLVRIDFILQEDQLFFLEVNTIPGLSRESILPKQAATYGITMQDLYTSALLDCLGR